MKDRKNSHQLLWNFARSPHLSVTIGLAYQCVIFFADWYWRVHCNLGLPWPFHLRLYFMNGIKENKKPRGIKSSRVTNPWSMLQPNLNAVIPIMFSVRPLSSVSYPAMSCWYWKPQCPFRTAIPGAVIWWTRRTAGERRKLSGCRVNYSYYRMGFLFIGRDRRADADRVFACHCVPVFVPKNVSVCYRHTHDLNH